MLARRNNSQALLLAGDTVFVSIQVFAISRITSIQGRRASRLRSLAVGVRLLLRLRLGGRLPLGALSRARVTATEPAAPARRVVRRLRSGLLSRRLLGVGGAVTAGVLLRLGRRSRRRSITAGAGGVVTAGEPDAKNQGEEHGSRGPQQPPPPRRRGRH